jgi:hypothetical protein
MLTLAEIESTLQIEYESRLEALGEQALRERLAGGPAALRSLAPHHLSDDELLAIAETTLAELVARNAPAVPEPPAPPGPPWAWPQFLTWFWTPLR